MFTTRLSLLPNQHPKIESLRLKLRNDTRDQRVTGVLSDLTVKSLSKRWTENRTEMEHLAQVHHDSAPLSIRPPLAHLITHPTFQK